LPATEIVSNYVEEAERLGTVLREAGALALKTFRTSVKSWIKGHNSPVSEADMAVDALLREKLSRPDIGWLSATTTGRGLKAMRFISPIRSTARGPISRVCQTGRSARLWSSMGGRSSPVSTCQWTINCSSRHPGKALPAMANRSGSATVPRSQEPGWRARRAFWNGFQQ
jgi:hypothetical protein